MNVKIFMSYFAINMLHLSDCSGYNTMRNLRNKTFSDYDPAVRPNVTGDPVDVYANLTLWEINKLDEKTQTLTSVVTLDLVILCLLFLCKCLAILNVVCVTCFEYLLTIIF